MSRENGGPAFPLKEPLSSDSEGMSLRDYFAAKAMQALIANNWPITGDDGLRTSVVAFRMADDMLAASSA